MWNVGRSGIKSFNFHLLRTRSPCFLARVAWLHAAKGLAEEEPEFIIILVFVSVLGRSFQVELYHERKNVSLDNEDVALSGA